MSDNQNDLTKLVGLSIMYELFKKGEISETEFRKIVNSEKELLKANEVEFSFYISE